VNKRLVPSRDFVLLFRDSAIEQGHPTALASVGQSGHQAVSVSILPDFRPVKVRLDSAKVTKDFEELAQSGVDFDAAKTYSVNSETDEESKEPVYVEPKQNEYIFLIDRSGSMQNTIKLARQALQLFL